MTKKEIEIIISNDDLWDMLHYAYCLRRAPQQFNNLASVASEFQQVERVIISEITKQKNKFD